MGEWTLSPSIELTSEMLRAGVQALESELRGGPVERISRALMTMIAVTRRPSTMDDERAKLYFAAIQQAMLDYPVDVVERALSDWRKGPSGEWWPAEAELRRSCEKLFEPCRKLRHEARELLRQLERDEETAARALRPSPFAGDAHRVFREAMRVRLAPHRFGAYFNIGHIQYAGERLILVRTEVAEHVLTKVGADVIEQYDLTIRFDREAFANVRAPEEEMTPEKHAWVAQRMIRLTQAMAKNENIEALIEEGIL